MAEKQPSTQRRLAGAGEGTSANSPGPDTQRAIEIVNQLEDFREEAVQNRSSGENNRDDKWEENLNLYWNRYNFGAKAKWQSQEVMPEVPVFVDRFAAAMKEALVQSPDGFYTVIDPADKENDVAKDIKTMTDIWLSTSGRTVGGHTLGFPAVFEEQIKLGALMAMSSTVSWKRDGGSGRVAIEHVDPRMTWFDTTNRDLYRIRRIPLDKHELTSMVKAKDGKGNPIFNLPEVERLLDHLEKDPRNELEGLTGASTEAKSSREPMVLDEYIATLFNDDGIQEEKKLFVVANEQFLVRGPEKIPYKHGRDWLVYTPLVPMPLSVYGRAYMEDLGSVAKTFTELTNLILDATKVTALRNIAIVPEMLVNPGQAREGWTPGKTWLLEMGGSARDFAQALELGTLPPDVLKVWEGMKNELREASGMNEIGLGQFAPKSRTSATEVSATREGSAALVRSVAQTVETRYLEPTLDLVWKTGMQFAKPDDPMMKLAIGDRQYAALLSRRDEAITRPITFQARGISTLIHRANQLKTLLSILQVIAASPELVAAFRQKIDVGQLIEVLFQWANIDIRKLQLSERDKLIQEMMMGFERMGEGAGGGAPQSAPSEGGGIDREMGDLASILTGA